MEKSLNYLFELNKERRDSVPECLTRDQGVAGSSLTGGIA